MASSQSRICLIGNISVTHSAVPVVSCNECRIARRQHHVAHLRSYISLRHLITASKRGFVVNHDGRTIERCQSDGASPARFDHSSSALLNGTARLRAPDSVRLLASGSRPNCCTCCQPNSSNFGMAPFAQAYSSTPRDRCVAHLTGYMNHPEVFVLCNGIVGHHPVYDAFKALLEFEDRAELLVEVAPLCFGELNRQIFSKASYSHSRSLI